MTIVPTSLALLLLLGPGPPAGADETPAAAPTEVVADAACAQAAVGAVQRRYESLRDLSARFTQEAQSVALGGPSTATRSTGRVVFAKPGRVRWSYEEPEESLVVSDGEWLWIYDPAAAEAQKLPVGDGAITGSAIEFLLGEGRITESFRVEAESCGATSARLRLHPLAPATYEKLVLVVDPRSGEIRATEVTDLLGNHTRVVFSEIRADTGPRDELFRFVPPEGVDVVELAAPQGSAE